ncbi:MAG: CPBP family intramembrane metalloprotease [Spirochaetales bacterium]|nr:CPBP family intramembrane metalloprotease [Spirochaetales bacterium]
MAIYIVEIIVVMVLFLLPSFIPVSADGGWDVAFFVVYFITAAPQIFLLWFYLKNREPESLPLFGLVKISFKDTLFGLLFMPGLLVIYFVIVMTVILFPPEVTQWFSEGYRWHVNHPELLPLIFVFCIVTGYREELLFRSFLYVRCTQLGIPVPLAILVNSLLFASLHIYEGPLGFVFAFAISLYLAHLFYRYRNIHIIGLSHALFNFTVLLLSILNIVD